MTDDKMVEIKNAVGERAWLALRAYFDGKGNGPEAKVACVVIGTLAREQQAENNRRQLDLVEKKMGMEVARLSPARIAGKKGEKRQ